MLYLVVVCGSFLLFLVLFLVLFFIVVERCFVFVVVKFELLWLNVDFFNGFDVCFFLRFVLICVLFCFFVSDLDDLM